MLVCTFQIFCNLKNNFFIEVLKLLLSKSYLSPWLQNPLTQLSSLEKWSPNLIFHPFSPHHHFHVSVYLMADSSTISNSSSNSIITTTAVSEQLSFNFLFLSISRSVNVSFYFHWSSQLLLFPSVFTIHRTASLFFLKLCFLCFWCVFVCFAWNAVFCPWNIALHQLFPSSKTLAWPMPA